MTPREWMDIGTELFRGALARLTDAELDAPSLLPGWTRKHVVVHVHHNAEALRRLVRWAATGVEHRMYQDERQRTDEIEASVQLPAARVRALVAQSADALSADLDALSPHAWSRLVVTAQGRTVAATEIPWMRAREVAVHAVDLAAGVVFADLPEDLNGALIVDAVGKQGRYGLTADLAAWLTGRTAEAPTLGPWL